MKNICFVDSRNIDLPKEIEGFKIFKFEAHERICQMFPHLNFSIKNFLRNRSAFLSNKSSYAESLINIDQLLRAKNEDYLTLANEFNEFIKKNEIHSVIFWISPFHPNILYELNNVSKIGLMIDDPYSTYFRTQPYFNFLDGIAFISPSFSDTLSTKEFLNRNGVENSLWWPLSTKKIDLSLNQKLISEREKGIVYCGDKTGRKGQFLIKLKNHYKKEFHLHGNWPLKGFYGFKGLLTGQDYFFKRITPYSKDLYDYYKSFKIGINLHVSDKVETGNMRMYQLPACGVMQICDKSSLDFQNGIFEDGKEIIYYDNFNDLLDKTNYYLNNDNERIEIAFNGYKRYLKDYEYHKNLIKLLDFSCNPRKNND